MENKQAKREYNRQWMQNKRAEMTPEERQADNKRAHKTTMRQYRNDEAFRKKFNMINSEYQRRRYRNDEAFRERQKAKCRAYYWSHHAKCLETQRIYRGTQNVTRPYVRHKYGISTENRREYMRVWRANNKERIKQYNAKRHDKERKDK